MKKLGLLTLFLCFAVCHASLADADTLNWCGTYYEQDGQGFIRLAREDLAQGSSSCSLTEYSQKVENTGQAVIALNFTKSRSALGNWRKFDNHLIEVRGKIRNGSISNTRFIRDIGI